MDNSREIRSDEALRIWIINHLAAKLPDHAILKGGMVLRLLNCPRYTNDVDYIMIPFKSKKEIVTLLQKAFQDIPGLGLTYQLHSTNARFFIQLTNAHGLFKTQIETNVAKSCEKESISTGDAAIQYHQQPQVVPVMRLDVALAHKLAAWNERELMRDLYDVYFIYKNLNTLPNLEVLQKRLQKITHAKRVYQKSLPRKMTLEEFWEKLRQKTSSLNQTSIEEELRDSFDPTYLAGLDMKIKAAVRQMIEELTSLHLLCTSQVL